MVDPSLSPDRKRPALRFVAIALLFALLTAIGAPRGAMAQDYSIFESQRTGEAPASDSEAAETDASAEAPADGEAGAEEASDGAPAEGAPIDGAADEEGGPDLAAYGKVAETFESESALQMTQQQVNVFRQKARRIIGAADVYFSELDRALDAASPTGNSTFFLGVLLFTGILLAIGRAASQIYGLYVVLPVMRRIQRPHPDGIVDKLPVLAARVGLQLGGVLITLFVAAAVGAGFYQEEEATLKTVFAIAAVYFIVQMIDVLWRMVLSPFLPEYRIPHFSDRDARKLYRWLAAGTLIGVAANIYGAWLQEMGTSEEVLALTTIGSAALALLVMFGMLKACGGAITNAILGGYTREEATWIAAVGSVFWRPVVIAYLIFAFGEVAYRQIMALESSGSLLGGAFVVLLAGLVSYAVTIYVIARIFRRARQIRRANEAAELADADETDRLAIRDALSEVDGDSDGDGDEEGGGAGPVAMADRAAPPRRRGMRTFEDLARRVASIFALGAGAYALVRLWFGPTAFEEGSNFDIAQDLIDLSFIGYIAFHAARIWMDRKIEEEVADMPEAEPGDEGGGASAVSRLGTILPLVRTFVLLVIAVTSVMLILMEFGVNVAPLFAGAGVVGLAIGFGAQSLVRDILSGIFFLSDDAFRKGEYIDIGDVKGTVEKISLRSFQLRHHLGALNTIPFGEIKHITNYSRDWVMMKLPLRLTYDTDVEKVRKLVKKLGQQLLDHPTEGHKFVQPLKSQGVYMMEDSAMIIRVKFMTRPGDQWTTRKLIYQEIRSLFEKEGIKFAHKEVTVRIPDLDDHAREGQMSEQERKAIGAAARRAVEEDEALAPAGGDTR